MAYEGARPLGRIVEDSLDDMIIAFAIPHQQKGISLEKRNCHNTYRIDVLSLMLGAFAELIPASRGIFLWF